MSYMNEFPHTRNHDSDLREILEMFNAVHGLPKEWEEFEKQMSSDWSELKTFVSNYFADLNVQEEVNAKIDALVSDGTIESILRPIFNDYRVEIDSEINILKARMDEFTALAEGSTTGDAEMVDARIDYKGKTHANLGGHIREVTSEISSELDGMETYADLVEEIGAFWINHYSHVRTTDDSYISSEYIRVNEGQTYYLTAINQAGNEYSTTLNLYDIDKNWLSDARGDFNDSEWIAPINGFIIITNYGDTKPICNTLQNFVARDIAGISEELDSLRTAEDLVTEVGAFYINRRSYERVNNGRYMTSEYIEVKAGNVYIINASGQSGNKYDTSMALYNTNKEFLGYYTKAFVNAEWTAREDGYIIVSMFNNGKPSCMQYANHIMKEIAKIKDMEKIVSNLRGKSIIWYGTSIPDGSYSNNYPKMVGELLNCTVINQALGSSTARTGITSRVTEDEPMGIGKVSWKIGTRALTQTLAEKQAIIDEWDVKWGANGTLPFSGAPDTLTEDDKALILNSSYEVRLTPYIDGTYKMPDVFVFDHGWNDAAYDSTESELSTIPSDDNDRHYFIGAMNRLIRMILAKNPRAKILFIGHFENDERRRVNNAQEVLADIWGMPLLKLWEISGISTKEVTVDGVNTTIKKLYCPDGIHPHSDESGETNLMLATKIAKWINTVV